MRSIALCALMALGCGSAAENEPEQDVQLGTLEQGLTRPTGYGYNRSNYGRCTSLNNCALPLDKSLTYRFFAGTCTSWWQARMVTAVDNWQNLGNDLGWSLAFANTADIELRCGDLPTAISGQALARNESLKADGHYSYSGSLVTFDTPNVEGGPTWTGKTDVQRQRFAINLIAHELGHSVGLGHFGSSVPDPTVMHTYGYDSMPYYSDDENNMLADYIP